MWAKYENKLTALVNQWKKYLYIEKKKLGEWGLKSSLITWNVLQFVSEKYLRTKKQTNKKNYKIPSKWECLTTEKKSVEKLQ